MTRDTCRHNPKDTIHRRSQRISGPFILGRKYLGAITIQHGIHNITRKIEPPIPTKKRITRQRSRGAVQKDACENGKYGKSTFPSELRDLDECPTEKSSGEPNSCDDK